MRRLHHILLLACLSFLVQVAMPSQDANAQILPSLGGDRAGTSGFQFLKIPVDARGAALGETVVATTRDASSLFWNPALVAQTTGLHVGLYQASYFVDVKMSMAAATYNLGVAGLSVGGIVQTMDSGDMDVTTEFEPFGTGQTFSLRDLAVGLTLSQRLTDLFSYGVTAKYVNEAVVGLSSTTVVFDMGIFYRIGDSGASMAVSVRNFGLDGRPKGELERTVVEPVPVRVETEFEAMTPPTTFLLGFAYELLRNRPDNRLVLSAQLNNPSDNAETWNLGLEYTWNDLLSLRTGYRLGFEEARLPSAGIGLVVPGLGPRIRFDYGFNRLERLGNVHRFGLNLGL